MNPVQCRCCMEGVCFQNATENIGKVEAYRDFRARIPACMYFLKLRAMAGEMLGEKYELDTNLQTCSRRLLRVMLTIS